MKVLKDIPTIEFCRKLGFKKAIEQKHSTRKKKQVIRQINKSLNQCEKLGIEVILKPPK